MKNLKILFKNMELFIPYIHDESIDYSNRVHRGYRLQDKFMKLYPNFSDALIADWKKEINSIDIFIMFDSHYSKHIAEYIKRNNPNSKIYFYFWNSIRDNNIHFLQEELVDEFWTFDKEDAAKYEINYNQQFYTRNIKLNQEKELADTFFIGREKDRKTTIENASSILKENNVDALIYLANNKETLCSYSQYLEYLSKTKTILDIVRPNQSGLTLRCMESLFLGKKLITTNPKVSDYDFYNPQNIFILGEDDSRRLVDFINSKYINIDEEIISNYDYSSWVKRFTK